VCVCVCLSELVWWVKRKKSSLTKKTVCCLLLVLNENGGLSLNMFRRRPI